jgi:hypothetical protein
MMFLGFFGAWWSLAGCLGLYGLSFPVLTIATLAGLSIVLMGLLLTRQQPRQSQDAQGSEWGQSQQRTFRNINLAQWAAIVLLLVVLNIFHRTEWILPGIMLIVGLHFLPLAKLFSNGLNAWTGAALIAVAVSYPHIAQAGPSSPNGPLAAGFILWVSALITLVPVMRHRSLEA